MSHPMTRLLAVSLAAVLGAQSIAAARPDASAPASLELPDAIPAPAYMLLADATPRDTVYVSRPHRGGREEYDIEFLKERRDRFARMQSNGFGLIMSGVATGVGGIVLMVVGASVNAKAQREWEERNDSFYYDEPAPSDGVGLIVIGYLSLVAATPAFVITGIILNRVGNGRRIRYEELIEEHPQGGELGLEVGINSLRLTYSF